MADARAVVGARQQPLGALQPKARWIWRTLGVTSVGQSNLDLVNRGIPMVKVVVSARSCATYKLQLASFWANSTLHFVSDERECEGLHAQRVIGCLLRCAALKVEVARGNWGK